MEAEGSHCLSDAINSQKSKRDSAEFINGAPAGASAIALFVAIRREDRLMVLLCFDFIAEWPHSPENIVNDIFHLAAFFIA